MTRKLAMVAFFAACGGSSGNAGVARVYLSDSHTGSFDAVIAQAGFFPHYPASSTVGPCDVASYTLDQIAGPYPSAGTVTLTVSGRASPIVLEPPGDGGLYGLYVASNEHVFAGGEMVSVVATGGEVPAFSAHLTAPAPLVLSNAPFGAGATIDRSQPITVSWSAATSQVSIVLSAAADGGTTIADCRFTGSAGSGTVPSSVLQLLPASSSGIFGIAAITSAPTAAGSWNVHIDALDQVFVQPVSWR
jgi:hypothetical protein